MTLPSFLGIGAMRSGTTWLDRVLRSHPDIYLPERRKEVHFFDQYHDRGLAWYETFFPEADAASEYLAIGEITPKYLSVPVIPALIKESLPDCKFILILRNPADRAYSHYSFLVKKFGEKRDFNDFLMQNSDAFARGLYAQHIDRYLEHFPLENFLILTFEQTMAAPEASLAKIADFLGIDAARFEREQLYKKANSSGKVRFPWLWDRLMGVANFIRRQEVDWLWNAVKNTGIKKVFETNQSLPPMDPTIRNSLLTRYQADMAQLATKTGLDLSVWQSSMSE